MELKIYLRILLRKWWVIIPCLLITFTSTVTFTFTQTPVYEATATFIVTPAETFGDIRSFASGLDMLSRRTEIATTYAEIAVSRLIRSEASEVLGLSQSQRRSLLVDSKLRSGTNVLEVTVQGSDPALVKDFANMVGAKTMAYAEDLYEVYSLNPLDQAGLPSNPVKPNKRLNVALGVVFGLALGVGLAFLSAYFQGSVREKLIFDIIDERTGAYNKRYFMQRLSEEMSRAKRNNYPLSVAMINFDRLSDIGDSHLSAQARDAVMHRVAAFLKKYARSEDVIARVGKTTFAILLPDMSEQAAKAMMENLHAGMMRAPLEVEEYGVKIDLNGATGIAAYQQNGTRPVEFMAQADFALKHAEAAGYGKVSLFQDALLKDENGKRGQSEK